MEKYDELVKALIACSADGKCGTCDYMKSGDSILCMEMLISEAANAIKELQHIHEQDEELIARLANKHAKIFEVLNG